MIKKRVKMCYVSISFKNGLKRVSICLIPVHFLEQINESSENGFHVLGEYMPKVINSAKIHVFCHIYDEKRTEEMDSSQKHKLWKTRFIQ